MNDKKICIFDIDGTIFASNSTFDFLHFSFGKTARYRRTNVLFGNIFSKILNRILFKVFSFDLKRKMYIRILKGKSRTELEEFADIFCSEFLNFRKNNDVIGLISQLKDENICFVSATLDFLSKRIILFLKNLLSLENVTVLSTELLYKNGICTGKIKKDLLNKKLFALNELRVEKPFDFVVSDDLFDIPLMENSRESYVVLTKKNKMKWEKKLKSANFKFKTIDTQGVLE